MKRYENQRLANDSTYWSLCFSPMNCFVCLNPVPYQFHTCMNMVFLWFDFRVLFELLWRDYFRFLSIKYGNSLFHPGKLVTSIPTIPYILPLLNFFVSISYRRHVIHCVCIYVPFVRGSETSAAEMESR